MTRSLARHLGLRLLALVMSGVILAPKVIHAYDITRNDNNDGSGQQDMSAYCQDDTIDNIIIAFLDGFGTTGGEVQLNLANACSSSSDGSKKRQIADCSFMSSQIKQCQSKGKIVTLSLGGAISQIGFSTDSQGRTFADKIWDMFLSGSGQQRPFGDAILDGVDLDIEQGVPRGYAAFVNRLRDHAANGTNQLYTAYIGQALNDAPFDAVYVQFYNNYCGLADPKGPMGKNGSANPDIKVYIGALAGQEGSGYVDSNTLAGYITYAQRTWSSFGGVMLWEASLAVANNNYHKAVKNSLLRGGAASGSPSANGTASISLHTPGAAPTSLSAPWTTSTSLSSGGAAPPPLSANGTASTSLHTPGAAPTSLSAPFTTSTSLSSGGAAPPTLSTNTPPPTSTSPYANGAKCHRRSRFRNHSRATKHSH
ncbi:glycoside hydrolase superfamily [Russula emetica]|nr:glycoside hydrolase superfamily [Russula emetica]